MKLLNIFKPNQNSLCIIRFNGCINLLQTIDIAEQCSDFSIGCI